jgi:hypothetical protein
MMRIIDLYNIKIICNKDYNLRMDELVYMLNQIIIIHIEQMSILNIFNKALEKQLIMDFQIYLIDMLLMKLLEILFN